MSALGLLKSLPNLLSAPTRPDITPWSYPNKRNAWQEQAVTAKTSVRPRKLCFHMMIIRPYVINFQVLLQGTNKKTQIRRTSRSKITSSWEKDPRLIPNPQKDVDRPQKLLTRHFLETNPHSFNWTWANWLGILWIKSGVRGWRTRRCGGHSAWANYNAVSVHRADKLYPQVWYNAC